MVSRRTLLIGGTAAVAILLEDRRLKQPPGNRMTA
jgi:hypothetical protein